MKFFLLFLLEKMKRKKKVKGKKSIGKSKNYLDQVLIIFGCMFGESVVF